MQRRGVVCPYRRGDAALGVASVALIQAALGYEENRAVLFSQDSGVKPSYPAADD